MNFNYFFLIPLLIFLQLSIHHRFPFRLNCINTVPPVIEEFKFDGKLQSGMRTRIYCNVARGDPPVQLTWLKDGYIIGSTSSHSLSTSSHHSHPFNSLSSSPSRITGSLSSSSSFSSSFGGREGDRKREKYPHLPPPSLQGIQVREIDEFSLALLIENLNSTIHDGNYTCIASNSAASVTHSSILLVNGKLMSHFVSSFSPLSFSSVYLSSLSLSLFLPLFFFSLSFFLSEQNMFSVSIALLRCHCHRCVTIVFLSRCN